MIKLQIFWGLSLSFKVRNSVFSYVVKSFWYALILLRHTWVKTERKGRIKNILPHKTKQSSLPWNKARNGKKSAFFCQFSSSASFSSVYFVYLFLLFFVVLLPLILLLLLLLLNDQIANFLGAFTLFQGKELCFFLWFKKVLIRPYSAASYMS